MERGGASRGGGEVSVLEWVLQGCTACALTMGSDKVGGDSGGGAVGAGEVRGKGYLCGA